MGTTSTASRPVTAEHSRIYGQPLPSEALAALDIPAWDTDHDYQVKLQQLRDLEARRDSLQEDAERLAAAVPAMAREAEEAEGAFLLKEISQKDLDQKRKALCEARAAADEADRALRAANNAISQLGIQVQDAQEKAQAKARAEFSKIFWNRIDKLQEALLKAAEANAEVQALILAYVAVPGLPDQFPKPWPELDIHPHRRAGDIGGSKLEQWLESIGWQRKRYAEQLGS